MKKTANTKVEIEKVIAERWSARAFDANKPVTQAQTYALLEAARWAPSCFGDEPWRFIVFDKQKDSASWQKAFDCLSPGNQAWVENAPILILACTNTLFGHNEKPNRFAEYDTGAAVENLCLQATGMGLAAHQMGGYDVEKARTAFSIPAQYTLMAMVCVGYQAAVETLTEEMKERELAPRKRKEMGQLFYDGMWDKPVI